VATESLIEQLGPAAAKESTKWVRRQWILALRRVTAHYRDADPSLATRGRATTSNAVQFRGGFAIRDAPNQQTISG